MKHTPEGAVCMCMCVRFALSVSVSVSVPVFVCTLCNSISCNFLGVLCAKTTMATTVMAAATRECATEIVDESKTDRAHSRHKTPLRMLL